MQDGRPPTQHHFMVVEMWMGGPAVAEVELAKDVWVDVEQDEGGKVAEAAAAFKTKVGGDRLIKGTAICTTTCYPSAVVCLRCPSLRFVQFIGFTPHGRSLKWPLHLPLSLLGFRHGCYYRCCACVQIAEEHEVFQRSRGEALTTCTYYDAHAKRYNTVTMVSHETLTA